MRVFNVYDERAKACSPYPTIKAFIEAEGLVCAASPQLGDRVIHLIRNLTVTKERGYRPVLHEGIVTRVGKRIWMRFEGGIEKPVKPDSVFRRKEQL